MRLVILSAAAALLAATPAVANEIRVEARGGAIWNDANTEAVAGVAAGYDFDLGEKTFVGMEVSGDKVLVDGAKVLFGFTGRGGAKLGAGKVYVDGGYSTTFDGKLADAWHLGAGYEHAFGEKLYGKIAYRHYFNEGLVTDTDAVMAGVGVKF